MDPVTAAKAAQIIATLARSKTVRTIVVVWAILGMIMAAVVVTAPASAVLGLLQAMSAQQQAAQGQAQGNTSCENPAQTGFGNLDAEQVGNAYRIWQISRDRKLPDRAAVIAIATALQESSLRNLTGGDRDSVGLFQQRPSQGWGTIAQLTDPAYATGKFLDALVKIDRWESMPLSDAAQAVQRSALPGAYARWEATAAGLVTHYSSGGAGDDVAGANRQAVGGMCAPDAGAASCPATGYGVESGLTPDAVRVLRCLHQSFAEVRSWGGVGDRPANVDDDHQTGRAVDVMIPDYRTPAGRSLGDRIAAYAVKNREALGVRYVIWQARIWSVAHEKEGWRDCSAGSCYSGPNDTLAHRDHVHVSVYGNSAGAATPSGPVVTPVEHYTLTARFGQCASQWTNCHTGLDFAAPYGTTIRAVSAGTVTFAGWGNRLGNLVKLDHGDGTASWYAHQSVIGVHVGDRVTAGQAIGKIGMTGNTSGPHVHLEIRTGGVPTDPQRWYTSKGVRL